MINHRWAPAIVESAVKHFQSQAESAPLAFYAEGSGIKKEELGEWMEFRYIGPDYSPVGGKNSGYRIQFEVDILIQTPAKQNIYRLPELEGLVASMFTCFEVTLEDSSSVGIMQRPSDVTGEIETTQLHAGQDVPILHSRVAALFEMKV